MLRWIPLLLIAASGALANDIPLTRDARDYVVMGLHSAAVKNLAVVTPSCNVGVNCVPMPTDAIKSCGTMKSSSATIEDPGQWVANKVCDVKPAGEEEDVKPVQALETGHGVGGNVLVRVADVRHTVRVRDGSGDVERGLG